MEIIKEFRMELEGETRPHSGSIEILIKDRCCSDKAMNILLRAIRVGECSGRGYLNPARQIQQPRERGQRDIVFILNQKGMQLGKDPIVKQNGLVIDPISMEHHNVQADTKLFGQHGQQVILTVPMCRHRMRLEQLMWKWVSFNIQRGECPQSLCAYLRNTVFCHCELGMSIPPNGVRPFREDFDLLARFVYTLDYSVELSQPLGEFATHIYQPFALCTDIVRYLNHKTRQSFASKLVTDANENGRGFHLKTP